ncbi:dual specificity protein phosphatase family protein [bacterium]|nr:dual specificity protein phosphatase family protein [bacterium]
MQYKFALMSLASVLALCLQESWLVRLGFGWVAFCFAWLALVYGPLGPRALLKGAEGRLSWLSWFMLWPYHFLNSLCLWAARFSSEPPFHEVLPGIYLGRRLSSDQADRLMVSAVLDVTAELSECPRFLRPGIAYQLLPTLDKRPLSRADLAQAVDFIRTAQGPVYVHCALGHGRSASVVAAYLLTLSQPKLESVDEAEAMLVKIRPGVGLTAEQKQSVQDAWERMAPEE